MNKHTSDAAKALNETRRKNAAAAHTARYAELDRLTDTTLEERIKELNTKRNARQ